MTHIPLFATCPRGVESLLAKELTDLGAFDVKREFSGVRCSVSSQQDVYRICLWSRLANRVLRRLALVDLKEPDDIYNAVRSIDWGVFLRSSGRFRVDFVGTNRFIRNTQFGGLKIKDAIVDQFRDGCGERPDVDKETPQLIVHGHLNSTRLTLSIDVSGDSLHRRGYRLAKGAAPLKENLAAAILLRSGWPIIAKEHGELFDPMCGSGTFLIEAAMMALDIAPGLLRTRFAFMELADFDADAWSSEQRDALLRQEEAKSAHKCTLVGFDCDGAVLDRARENIERIHLQEFIELQQVDVRSLQRPSTLDADRGLVITNPPYGERLGEVDQLAPLYRELKQRIGNEFPGWSLGVFTGNQQLEKELGRRFRETWTFYNGAIESHLLLQDLPASSSAVVGSGKRLSIPENADDFSDNAKMLLNRLKKNRKNLRRWIERESISSYRLYDADLPEYSAAIDVYGEFAHIQEYAAPKSIDQEKVRQRLEEIILVSGFFLEFPLSRISCKQRRKTAGKSQYEKLQSGNKDALWVTEGAANLRVNLWEYLDTGLFLDHRPVRRFIYEHARGKRFLNLFCYTATASVHAALGGASGSVSVDLSPTYLRWAEDNFSENRLSLQRHQLIQADCQAWLNQCREGFDLILLDPPSFSNSKRTDNVLDIQRDHVGLIRRCMEILNPGGKLIFSNNLRSFKLDRDALDRYLVTDILDKTLDPDFQRNRKIHHCWLIEATKR